MPAPAVVCTMDIEASGFGRDSYPIEIGFVRENGSAWCTLIAPASGWRHWDADAERVHGISRATLRRHGRPAELVARQLNQRLAGCTVYCDAWAYDYPWLARLFESAALAPAFRLESAARLLDERGWSELPRLHREALQAMGLQRHRASNDARALQSALAALATTTLPG